MDNDKKEVVPEVPVQKQLEVEDYLANDNLNIILKKIDDDFTSIEIIGSSIQLKGKCYKLPTDSTDKRTTLSVMYLERI